MSLGKKFTIITVTLNSEDTIRDTIESVLGQTYSNFEYIIIDGKSKDNTLEIVNSYLEKFDGRLTVISEKDNGIYSAMNKGISLSTGNIIGIINSDDWYEPDTLQNVIDNYSCNSHIVYYGIMRTIDAVNSDEVRCEINSPKYINERMINHPAIFVDREVYKKFGTFDETYKYSSDYELFIRYSLNREITFLPIYSILANFRRGGVSSSTNALVETMKIKRKYGMITRKQYLASIIFLFGRKVMKYPVN